MADERDDSGAAILERAGVRAVRAALRAAGIADEVRVLGTTAPTAAAAAEQLGCPVGAIADGLSHDIRAARRGDRWHGRGRGLRSTQRYRTVM
jgi:hypothetical protein